MDENGGLHGGAPAGPVTRLDAMIIGAGVAGLYQLHQLRALGLDVRAYDNAAGVGGTWYWNRYPGAKFDSESYIYQYLFSEELYKDWSWSERFPGQPEIERWMNYIADRLDLRRMSSSGRRSRGRSGARRPGAGSSVPTEARRSTRSS